ncbi:hypothetical protein [Amycolatopsis sp. cg9]|uniref:hypothetical protein n=1 Tax=Amycolatopsis sp. cg9 TaxID=3238801 RepID=UPI00352582AE
MQKPAEQTPEPDYGLVRPVSLPTNGRIPDRVSGASSSTEYDSYFRLVRDGEDLVRWSKTCLDVQRGVLADLDSTELTAEERYDIVAGCVVVLHATLERWHALHQTGEEEAAA